jgi:hypothetical protein
MKILTQSLFFLCATSVWADCPPTRACDQPSCAENHDTRSCGHDVNLVLGSVHVNDPVCEAAKATQNVLYASQHAACEADHLGKKVDCERLKSQEQATCDAQAVAEQIKRDPLAGALDAAGTAQQRVEQVSRELTRSGLQALPKEAQKGVSQLGDAAKNEIAKNPELASVLLTVLRTTNPVLAGQIDSLMGTNCVSKDIISQLATSPLPPLSEGSQDSGKYTTPAKKSGASGWLVTGCGGTGEGIVLYGVPHSSDDIYTVDVGLRVFRVGNTINSSGGRYIRVEVLPGTKAHKYLERHEIAKGQLVSFGGIVVWDTDLIQSGHRVKPFLEVHPFDDFVIVK